MRFAFPFLACACLLIGIAQFARHVHAQSATGSDNLRLTVEGNRLIRVEPAVSEPPASRRVAHWPENDPRQRALEAAGAKVRLPDADPQQARRASTADSRPKLKEGELVLGVERSGAPGPRLVRKPDPSQGRPEVTFR